MDRKRTDIKHKIRMLADTFVSDVNKYTMETRSKTNLFEWYNLYRNSSGKKGQRTAMFIDHFLSY